MISSDALLNSWAANALGWALVHSLWQGLLLAFALFAVLMVSSSPRLRYVAGVAATALLLAAFVVTFVLSVPQTTPDSPGPGISPGLAVWADIPLGISGKVPGRRMNLVVPYFAAFWLVGVCAHHLWQVMGFLSVRRLRRRGIAPVTERWQRELDRLRELLGVSRPVALFESLLANTPMVIGHLRPLILVPAGLFARLPDWQVQAILLHELTHIRRCDYMLNLLQRWVEGIFFYHPVVWWMNRVIRLEREVCCDDMAAAICGDRYRYAGALAALEESRVLVQSSAAMAATGSNLRVRVDRLLRHDQPSGVRGAVVSLTIVAATSALAFAGWQATETKLPVNVPAPEPKEALAPKPATSTVAPRPTLAQVRPAPEEGDVPKPEVPVMTSAPYQKWLNEDVRYLISDAERAAFERLNTDEERQTFIEQFWNRRNVLRRDVGARSAKEEHYRRIMYANDRYASGVPGWKTDRGRIYITWGPPSEIEVHPTAQNGRPPFELWRYFTIPGVRPAQFFTFVDVNSTGDYRLQTAEPAQPVVYSRMLRWTVTDPLNRLVTGLAQDQFTLTQDGVKKPFTYFEPPGTPTAVGVVSDSDDPELTSLAISAIVIQARTLDDAVRRLRDAPAIRKALIVVRGSAVSGSAAIPGGFYAVIADAPAVSRTVVEIANQYVAGYQADSANEPELKVESMPNMPPLRIAR